MTARQSADAAAGNLARNTAALRRARGFSQSQLARHAGVPRSTISNIESGQANPSLTSLVAVATALTVGLDELVGPPHAEVTLRDADQLRTQSRSGGRVRITSLLPERIRGVEIDRMRLAPRSSMKGQPHLPGTREFLHTTKGTLQVLLAGEYYEVSEGGVLAFAGDQPHSYRNGGDSETTALSVVIPSTALAD